MRHIPNRVYGHPTLSAGLGRARLVVVDPRLVRAPGVIHDSGGERPRGHPHVARVIRVGDNPQINAETRGGRAGCWVNQIIAAIDSVRDSRQLTVHRRDTDEGDIYELTGNRCRVEVVVDPERWLGLSFVLYGEGRQEALSYSIDTDMYPVTLGKYQEFVADIEDEIVGFLRALISGGIRVGSVGPRTGLIVPTREGALLIQKGRVLTGSKRYGSMADAESRGCFEPLRCDA